MIMITAIIFFQIEISSLCVLAKMVFDHEYQELKEDVVYYIPETRLKFLGFFLLFVGLYNYLINILIIDEYASVGN